MLYTFGLHKHVNIKYRESASRLARYELLCMLDHLGVRTDIHERQLGGAPFLCFESRLLSPQELSFLASHSSVWFMAESVNGLLSPIAFDSPFYLPDDLPEVLKYKGKTSVPFTSLMLNVALSLCRELPAASDTVILDPLCGKGTSCFCALQRGMNAVGLDLDQRDVKETADYFTRYLKLHMLKHTVQSRSETFQRHAVPVTDFFFADTKEHFQTSDRRFLRLGCGDTSLVPALTRHSAPHLILADLPYGIQHAPQTGSHAEPFRRLLSRALPVWAAVLRKGGVLALSFNTLTLPVHTVIDAMEHAGLHPFTDDRVSHFRHEVEQAIVRDVVFAGKDKEES